MLISHFTPLALLVGVAATLSTASAATLVLDDFSVGDFALQFAGPSNIVQNIPTPLTTLRFTSGSGVKDWHATLATGSGIMAYTLNLRGDPTDKSNYLDLSSDILISPENELAHFRIFGGAGQTS
jgi:hypothetical protein